MAPPSIDQDLQSLIEEFILAHEEGNNPSVDHFAAKAGEQAELFRQRILAYQSSILLLAAIGEHSDPQEKSLVPSPTGYEIIRELGRGGMGRVFLARQEKLNREVAIKVLTSQVDLGDQGMQRFLQEGRALASLQHSNIVRVIDVIAEHNLLYLVLELIRGPSLAAVLQELRAQEDGAFSAEAIEKAIGLSTGAAERPKAVNLAGISYYGYMANVHRAIADALHHAHEGGIIHRDVKPSMILLDEHGVPHLADFGLARINEGSQLTLSTAILGTPQYLSPEQISPEMGKISAQTDVYALGVTFYECLTHRVPFRGETTATTLDAVLKSTPAPVLTMNEAVPHDLAIIAETAMARLPGDRYKSAAAFRDDLANYLEHRAIVAKPTPYTTRIARVLRRHAWRIAAIIPVVIFLQIGVSWYQRGVTARDRLQEWADGVSKNLSYTNQWDLARLRQDENAASSFCVLDASGLNLAIVCFNPAMDFDVSFDWPPGVQNITVKETAERWRLLVKPVRNGTVILGFSSPEDITDVEKRLSKNAKLFGDSIESALQLNVNETDKYIHYAVVDAQRRLRFATGDIPVRLKPIRKLPFNTVTEVTYPNGDIYGVYAKPFRDGAEHTVGTVLTFDKLPPQPWRSAGSWLFIAFAFLVVIPILIWTYRKTGRTD